MVSLPFRQLGEGLLDPVQDGRATGNLYARRIVGDDPDQGRTGCRCSHQSSLRPCRDATPTLWQKNWLAAGIELCGEACWGQVARAAGGLKGYFVRISLFAWVNLSR